MLSATGGSERHALVLDHGLRPLFAFFSADIIATGVYATEAEFTDHRPQGASILSPHRPRGRRTELAALRASPASAATSARRRRWPPTA